MNSRTILEQPLATFARLAALVALGVDLPPGVLLDVIARELLARLRPEGCTIPSASDLAALFGIDPAAVARGRHTADLDEALAAAAGACMVRALGVDPSDPVLAGSLDTEGLERIGLDLARRVLVPAVVLEDVVGVPRPLFEDRPSDVAAFDGWAEAVVARCGVSRELAERRIEEHVAERIGEVWTTSAEAALAAE